MPCLVNVGEGDVKTLSCVSWRLRSMEAREPGWLTSWIWVRLNAKDISWTWRQQVTLLKTVASGKRPTKDCKSLMPAKIVTILWITRPKQKDRRALVARAGESYLDFLLGLRLWNLRFCLLFGLYVMISPRSIVVFAGLKAGNTS